MLEEYIKSFVDAAIEGNKKEMNRIERDLRKVGMDKATLVVLAREEYLQRKTEGK